jgi:O-antigen/teichoic acid export membrane protein
VNRAAQTPNRFGRLLPFRGGTREATLLSFGSQLEAILSFLTVLVLTRNTSVAEAGQVFFAQALASVIFLVLDPRLEDALQRYAALLAERGRAGAAATLFTRCLAIDVLIATVSGGLVLLALAVVNPAGGDTFRTSFVALAIVNAICAAPIGTAVGGFAITGRLLDLAGFRIAIAIVSATANVVAIVAGGPVAFLAVNAITTGLATVVVSIAAGRRVHTRLGHREPLAAGDVDDIVHFTVKSSIATSVQGGADQVLFAVAGATGGATFLAQLRVASAPGRFVFAAASPVASVLFPRLSTHAARGDRTEVRQLAERASRKLAPLAAVVAVGAIVAMPFVLPWLYGDAYDAATTAATLFAIAAAIRIVVVWSKVIMLAVGRPGVRLAAIAVESVVLLASTAVLADAGELDALAGVHVAVALGLATFWLGILRWKRLLASGTHRPIREEDLLETQVLDF